MQLLSSLFSSGAEHAGHELGGPATTKQWGGTLLEGTGNETANANFGTASAEMSLDPGTATGSLSASATGMSGMFNKGGFSGSLDLFKASGDASMGAGGNSISGNLTLAEAQGTYTGNNFKMFGGLKLGDFGASASSDLTSTTAKTTADLISANVGGEYTTGDGLTFGGKAFGSYGLGGMSGGGNLFAKNRYGSINAGTNGFSGSMTKEGYASLKGYGLAALAGPDQLTKDALHPL